jgi:RNA polymerase sigma-70 factor (sigma-E family)
MHAPPVDPELAAFAAHQHRRLVGLLFLQCGDLEAAQDLAQETIARVCQHWGRVRSMDDPAAWTARVAINLARSRVRRRIVERRALERHGKDHELIAPPDTAQAVAVRAAVARLPRRQRTALLLRYWADLSVDQTADVMGCRPGTVKSLTSKASSTLRIEFGAAAPDDDNRSMEVAR